ncbi:MULTISPECIES: hypothetical protein [Glutamicibacter]|jgi:hypothetical protein|uniref:Uncharacterized protein n=1 Tax=Glutamicibacter arilaitensis TaxID=256701 RepID=A0A4Y8TXV2_9MICC|nr:hypothetical protein [Glutamicibacter arilaitensis]TFH56986.1 hypothetical protein EXY26_08260 [Glutamicibacter arilaitensis]
MASDAVIFDDNNSVSDLANFISRAKTIEDDAALFVARNTALAVYVPVLVPADLGQGGYTILGMRVHRLAKPAEINASYSLASIQDRLARMGESSVDFALPPVEENPKWAGISVPLSGWEDAGTVESDLLSSAAQRGIDAVAQALPENPGLPVLVQVRQQIWAADVPDLEIEVPMGAAFAMHALGFLMTGGQCRVLRNGSWTRLSNERGHVLVRKASLLG